MKKFSSIVLAFVLILTGYSFVNAKNNKESTTITVDYSTLDSETVVELETKTNYQIEFINLPANISSTQLKKQFSGKFMNIRGKREKVSDASSSHRVRVKKAAPGFEGTVRLKLYEKVSSENGDDSSDENGDTASFRTNDEDNVLVETIQFTFSVAGSSDDSEEDDSEEDDSSSDSNGDTSSSNIQLDYNNLNSSTTVELEDSTQSISFINLPANITSTKLKKNFSGKFVNIRGKREKVSDNSSSHRVKIKKKKRSFEGTATLQLFEKSSDSSSDDNGDISSFRTSDDGDDNILVESIEFTLTYTGNSDDDSDDDDDDSDDDDDDSDDDDDDSDDAS